MLASSYGVSSGVFQGWGSMLGPIMQDVLPPADAEQTAGLLGMVGALAGIVGGVGLGFIADRTRRPGKRKALLVTSCSLGCVAFSAFALITSSLATVLLPHGWTHGPTKLSIMYATSIVGSVGVNAAMPLYFELAVEATYPVAEGLTTTSMTIVQNAPAALFLVLPMLPGLGTGWASWAVVGACAFATLVVLPLREPGSRRAVDAASDEVAPEGLITADQAAEPAANLHTFEPPPHETSAVCNPSCMQSRVSRPS